MSVTHSWSGGTWANCRSTARGRRRLVPEPGQRLPGGPFSATAAYQRSDRAATDLDAETDNELGVNAPGPQMPRDASRTAWICSVSCLCRNALAEGGRLRDAAVGRHRLSLVAARDARHQAAIDELLTAPGINHLVRTVLAKSPMR
jgi:hypothetical protein